MQTYVERAKKLERTARQLAALPDAGIYLVHSMKFADYCRQLLLFIGRDPATVRFATVDDHHRFCGVRASALDVDHAFYRHAGPRGREAVDFLSYAVMPHRRRGGA